MIQKYQAETDEKKACDESAGCWDEVRVVCDFGNL
jgi:hypothetical protein